MNNNFNLVENLRNHLTYLMTKYEMLFSRVEYGLGPAACDILDYEDMEKTIEAAESQILVADTWLNEQERLGKKS